MFETWTLSSLQAWWWLILSVIGGFLVAMTFIQGGQALLGRVGGDEDGKRLVLNALGRKWELAFTTLVLFGGALFAAFPLYYSVSFGGAYLLWMSILLTFVLQAVSYEFRGKAHNLFGARGFDGFLWVNGTAGVFLLGLAVGSLFTGAPFTRDAANVVHWAGSLRGFEAALAPFNLLLGLTLVLLARVLGALYLLYAVDAPLVETRARAALKLHALAFVPVYLLTVGWLLTLDGVAVHGSSTEVVPLAYLGALSALPVRGVASLLLGTVSVLAGVGLALFAASRRGFWLSFAGSVLVGVGLFSLAGHGELALYASTVAPADSLTLSNASSTRYTLVTMSYVSLLIPFVLAYIAFVWRAMGVRLLTTSEVDSDPLSY